jgi:hypothetical protein
MNLHYYLLNLISSTIGFKTINNHLTHGNIIRIDVPIHDFHDVHVEDNNVIIRNDQNDAFSGTLIDVYNLEVYNLKGHVYSQPHGCCQLKQYKKSSQPLFYLFIFVYFFILLEVMNEST